MFLSSFAPDAVVKDVGREFRRVAAIKEWGAREIFAVNVTLAVVEAVGHDGQTIVTVKVDGAFGRTEPPDPLVKDHRFTVTGDQIVGLTGRWAGEKPET